MKTKSIFFAFFMLVSCIGASAQDYLASDTTGTCLWTIDNEGLLTIKPLDDVSGDLANEKWYQDYAPWYKYRNSIKTAKIISGVNATSCSYMFYGLNQMTSVDLSGLNTENTTEMWSMFDGCSSLTSLNLANFKTQNVTDMYRLFNGCSHLTSLDLSSFDTHKVKDMAWMFKGCTSLVTVNLKSFNTENVTNMNGMFYGCDKLSNLNISNFNTKNVTDMSWMFNRCSKLTYLNLDNFDTQKVTDMHYMFNACSGLTHLWFKNLNTMKVTNMEKMFAECNKLANIIANTQVPSPLLENTFSTFPNSENCTLHVPANCKVIYSVADGWKELGKIDDVTEYTDSTLIAHNTCGTCIWIMRADGTLTITPADGVYGELKDWTADRKPAPWAEHSDTILYVTIDEGVNGIVNNMFSGNKNLYNIFWNTTKCIIPDSIFGADKNNVLIYAADSVETMYDHNVIIDSIAENIILTDGYALNIPKEFHASNIQYVRDFEKTTKIGYISGWEGIVLPFDVQKFTHETNGKITPFGTETDNKRQFWLAEYTNDGTFELTTELKANTPYIISMPNDKNYSRPYILAGKVSFTSTDVLVHSTDSIDSLASGQYIMTGSYKLMDKDYSILAINEDDIHDDLSKKDYGPGSFFVREESAKPFHAYIKDHNFEMPANKRIYFISFSENSANGISNVNDNGNGNVIYDLTGRRIAPSQIKPGTIYLKNKAKFLQK